ncbi:MAG: 4Fe-4S ferredoxin, partial [Asgard group archaeon]|nr:4Fe-4S ferredoxin [Asgard group archaeon]
MAKKVLIYYFSGTGNTFWVAKQLKQQLEKQNYETTIHSMENDFTTDDLAVQINTVDYVGFA